MKKILLVIFLILYINSCQKNELEIDLNKLPLNYKMNDFLFSGFIVIENYENESVVGYYIFKDSALFVIGDIRFLGKMLAQTYYKDSTYMLDISINSISKFDWLNIVDFLNNNKIYSDKRNLTRTIPDSQNQSLRVISVFDINVFAENSDSKLISQNENENLSYSIRLPNRKYVLNDYYCRNSKKRILYKQKDKTDRIELVENSFGGIVPNIISNDTISICLIRSRYSTKSDTNVIFSIDQLDKL